MDRGLISIPFLPMAQWSCVSFAVRNVNLLMGETDLVSKVDHLMNYRLEN